VPGGSWINRDAQRDFGITMQAPFALAGRRAQIGSPADQRPIERLGPAEITYSDVKNGAREVKSHPEIVSDTIPSVGQVDSTRHARQPSLAVEIVRYLDSEKRDIPERMDSGDVVAVVARLLPFEARPAMAAAMRGIEW
jgi:hypothetical protein